MIISHKYKYLFIQNPNTGSTSIGYELCENYNGKPILYKHATYLDFEEIATREEKKYFTFTTVRNPLDKMTTIYMRFLTDHDSWYTKKENLLKYSQKHPVKGY